MTISVEDFAFEEPMPFNPSTGQYEYLANTPVDLQGRRVTISTDEGGAYNTFIE